MCFGDDYGGLSLDMLSYSIYIRNIDLFIIIVNIIDDIIVNTLSTDFKLS